MSESVAILEGNTFVVSDRVGNVDASPTDPQGLFRDDTRFLSRWVLTINGKTPGTLAVDDLSYYAAQFFLTPVSSSVYVNSTLAVMRRREVGNGFHEPAGNDFCIGNRETGNGVECAAGIGTEDPLHAV